MSPTFSKADNPSCFLLLYFDRLTTELNLDCKFIVKLLYTEQLEATYSRCVGFCLCTLSNFILFADLCSF